MNKFVRGAIFFAVACAPLVSALAEEQVRVAAIFDKRAARVQEEIHLTIRITGSRANVLKPRVPVLEDFESYYTGRTNQFTFVNGNSQNTTQFNYVLIPKKTGRFSIPPIEVEVDSTVFTTDAIEIEVLAGAGGAQTLPAAQLPPMAQPASPQAFSQAPPIQKPVPQVSRLASGQDIFLNVSVDKREAYANEQILMTFSVYTRVSARAEQFEKDPNFTGFWVEEIPIEKDYQPERVIYGGLEYVKADVRRIAVFPTTTGILEMDPGVFRVTVKKESRPSSLFDDFFDESFFGGSFFARRETKLLTADPVKIAVRPLPQQGKPADFSGMVGSFQITSSVDPKSVKQNEPVLLTLAIEGEGNIETLERPKIPELKDVKMYDTDTSSQLLRVQGGVRGRKQFEVTLIPTRPGEVEIPPLSFSFFDPRQRNYQTLKTPPYRLQVAPGPAVPLPEGLETGPSRGELRKSVEVEGRDIHFIKENFPLEKKSGGPIALGILLAWDALLTVVAALLFGRSKYEERFFPNAALKRSRYALKAAQKALRGLEKLARSRSEENRRAFYEEASKILDQYFADKFNLSAQGLTFEDIRARLAEKTSEPARLEDLRAFYEVCHRVRFASAQAVDVRPEEILRVMRETIAFVEKK
jgi:hypothetical protein